VGSWHVRGDVKRGSAVTAGISTGKGNRPGGLGYGRDAARKAGIPVVKGCETGTSTLPFPNIF